MPTKHFRIEKVPLSYVPSNPNAAFPPFPLLYLELVENKEKVFPHLKNKTQDPVFLPTVHPYEQMNENKEFFDEKDIRSRLHERMKKTDQRKPSQEMDRQSVRERTLEHERDQARFKELSESRRMEAMKPSKENYQERNDYSQQPQQQYQPPQQQPQQQPHQQY